MSAIKEAYGFIERADVVDEIYFHVSETKHIPGGLKLGDDVDFCITMLGVRMKQLSFLCLLDMSTKIHLYQNGGVHSLTLYIRHL